MKLAEALIERKSIKNKIEDIKSRIYKNSQTQEGDKPSECPLELVAQLKKEAQCFADIVVRINKTNNETILENGTTLMEALTQRDMLRLEQFVLSNLADKATPDTSRYSNREIKFVPTVDVQQIRQQADELAKACRQLDMKIQEQNWLTELL